MIKAIVRALWGLVLGATLAGGQPLVPGVVTFRAHDPWNVGGPEFYTEMNDFLLANSYGRNWFVFQLVPDCQKLPCGVGCMNHATQTIDYSMTCSPYATGWDLQTVIHETGHLFGVGEGAAWDYSRNPPVLISEYGDPYDPEGSGAGRSWNSFYKEVMGFLGDSGLRPILWATNSGTYYISNAEDQSPGPKALKVLRNEYVLYREDGTAYIDEREFYYLEVRSDHFFLGASSQPAASPAAQAASLKGKGNGNGKHKHSATTDSAASVNAASTSSPWIGPAVQARLGTPHYENEPNGRIPVEAFLVNIGDYGGMASGMFFSDLQIIGSQDPYLHPATYVSRAFTVQVISVDSFGAAIQVTFQ